MNNLSDQLMMIDDIQQRESKLSEWEASFVADLDSRIDCGKSLTEKQDAKLEEIWDRVTQNG